MERAPTDSIARLRQRGDGTFEVSPVHDSLNDDSAHVRVVENTPVPDAQAIPPTVRREELYVQVRALVFEAAKSVDDVTSLVPRNAPEIALPSARERDDSGQSYASVPLKTSSIRRPRSPRAISASAFLIDLTYSGAFART